MADVTPPPPEVVRFYRHHKIPIMFGRLVDGSRIWGGPYTSLQLVSGCLVILGGLMSMPLWGHYGLLLNLFFLALVVVGVTLVTGMVRTRGRNPLLVAVGMYKAVCAPRSGSMGGQKVRLPRPHHYRGVIVADRRGHPPAQHELVPAPVAVPIESAAPPFPDITGGSAAQTYAPSKHPVSAVERLLAVSGSRP